MLSRRLTWLAWIVAALSLAFVCTTKAAAAPLDVDIVDEDFGFCDGLVPERWSPLRVYIASRKEPFSGKLVVTYAQDGTQTARVVLPVATTIGQVTPIEITLSVPEGLTEVKFRFEDGGSMRSREFRYELGGSLRQDPDVRDLPPEDAVGRRVVMFDGPRALDDALTQRSGITPMAPGMPAFSGQPANPVASPWVTTWKANLPRDKMPLTWAAYDSADVVVVRGDVGIGADAVDARTLEALKAWVKAGGKLVVLVEPAGDAWARFLDGAPVVEMSEIESRATSKRAVGVLGRRGEPEEGEDAIAGVAAADEMSARWMTLTETGVAKGWNLSHTITAFVDGASGKETTLGTCAIGPVGFGTVMLVSCDPAKMSAVVSSRATTRLWRDILTIILDRGTPRYQPSQNQWGTWYAGTSSGSNDTERAALEYVFSGITRVPNLGHGTFIAIAGVVLVLALLVGPFDAIVLRKRGWRQHSWATALLWVAIASAASIAAPMLIRSSDDRLFRLASYDAIAGKDGAVNLACREGATSILPGKGGLVQAKDQGNGVVYRGASPIVKRARERFAGTVLPLLQGVGETGTLRGITPTALSLRQWSVRAMLDECPEAKSPALSALRVECEIDAACVVRVRGLPPGASILRATVQTSRGWRALGTSTDPCEWSDPGPSQVNPSADWSVAPGSDRYFVYSTSAKDQAAFNGVGAPGVARSLPLSGTRTDTIERMVATGQWACVYLHILHWPSDIALDPGDGWTTESQAVLRVLVPLKTPTTATPATAPTPAPITPPPAASQP